MLKFNDNNIYSGYIKQLLASFNLPQCQIGKKDFYRDDSKEIYQSQHYIENNALYFYDAKKDESRRIDTYKENDYIQNITKNLEIRSNIYDPYTHEYLGDYLRYIRDYKNLDLMSMYNCFSNVVANVNIDSPKIKFISKDESYTIFAIPVKFKHTYTIAIDYHGIIEVCCGFYQNDKRFQSKLFESTNTYLFEEGTYQKFSGTRFRHPILYTKLNNLSAYDYINEKCLKMFLKVPNNCTSSIVILEGDYLDSTNLLFRDAQQVLESQTWFYQKDVDVYDLYDSNTGSLDYTYRYKSQLLQSNSGEVYLLADRLVEYLSNQAITPLDPVIDNIRRLQRKIYKEYKIPYNNFGIWDENQRKVLYRYIVKLGLQNKYNDVLSYLDKDVEHSGFDIEYYRDEDGNLVENELWQIQ